MRIIIMIIIKIIIEYANRLSNFKYNNELYNIENIVYLYKILLMKRIHLDLC